MINFKLRTLEMSTQSLQKYSLFLALLVAGCHSYVAPGNIDYFAESDVSVQYDNNIPSPEMLSQNDDGIVNYRKGAANYREFGERTPRDQEIVTNSGASNISAAIPPAIEEEVEDYETEVNAAISSSQSEVEDSFKSSGEDAVEDWLAEEGSTLKGLLTDWSERAGWRLIWDSNRNYTLAAGAMFRGRFADVSSALIRTFARARPAPVATFYKGNRVLVVETMEDENAYE